MEIIRILETLAELNTRCLGNLLWGCIWGQVECIMKSIDECNFFIRFCKQNFQVLSRIYVLLLTFRLYCELMYRTSGASLILYFYSRKCLLRSLRQCVLILEFVKSKGVEVRFHGRGKNEASHYCGQCEVSIAKSYEKVALLIL